MAPVLRSRAHSEQLVPGSPDTSTLEAQTRFPTMTRRTALSLRDSGSGSGTAPDPLLHDPDRDLQEEERRLDEQIALAYREESVRAKRAELA